MLGHRNFSDNFSDYCRTKILETLIMNRAIEF